MGGSARTLTLTALLCLGFCWGLWDQAQTGTLPKPSIWAHPSSMVTKGSHVTIWCQVSLQADRYYLYKDRVSEPLETLKTSQGSSNKAGFSITSMSLHDVGRYRCAYQSGESWSQLSDLLPLVMTGQHDAPSLSANPGPVVALGGNVSLSCSSLWPRGSFRLLKERGTDAPQHLEWKFHRERGQGLFHMGPVNTSHAGTYRCYVSSESYPDSWSHPSDPLHLQVTGVYRAPSLSAQPGSLVQSGDSVTLQCRSETGFDRFALTKDEELRGPQSLEGQPSPNFPLGPVSRTHGGRYRCYCGHKLSSTWSAPSAPLVVLITGMYEKPSLLAQPGTSVSWGENVTLQCRSEIWFDTFHLSKEGSLAPPQVLRLQDTAIPHQVNFILSPVTSDLKGTYRCYGSHSNYPYLLSQPSDPLELMVSGGSEDAAFSPQRGPHWYLYVLIGASVAFILLLGLLVFLLVRHQRRVNGRKPAAAASEDRGLHRSSGPEAAAQEENLYAVVRGTQPEDRQDRQLQAAVSEDQDVTYAQLNHLALRQETSAPPPSQLGEPPEEANVYAVLAIH
ncbi:leukocyte immunoglobulin-like receptor subfamily B member 3 isoform X1 [Lutra lutra]|uniref:leukocyte immunoglobulin-like receptor subfamily B member 3 isoform X1 n=1 Tax=Lutra lutra TaxID=9657 RepID=UPI001FD4BEDF|nr:leukocyte immunoglobulin-like receptor subfamily B member 3 isoform X1 [Lutra lutra]XP_047566301.1 leukocyte immunoglobulin-like receptor subfamily B member 3 isoform X1 [Lutra lutra]